MDAESHGAVVYLGPGLIQVLSLAVDVLHPDRGLVLTFGSIRARLGLGPDQGLGQDTVPVNQRPVPQALIVCVIGLEVEVIVERGPKLGPIGKE